MAKRNTNAEFEEYDLVARPRLLNLPRLFVSKRAHRLLRPEEIASADYHFHNRRWEVGIEEEGLVDRIPTALLYCDVLQAVYRGQVKGRQFRLRLDVEAHMLYVEMC